jgi:hypothetical protein
MLFPTILVALLFTLVFGQVEVQHCKPTTVTRTRVKTLTKTMTLRGTPVTPTSQNLKTVTKTVSAIDSPVTVRPFSTH